MTLLNLPEACFIMGVINKILIEDMLVLINQLELLEQVFGNEKAVSFLRSLIVEDKVIEFRNFDDYQFREAEEKWMNIIKGILKEKK